MTEASWTETARRASRKQVLAGGLLPAVIIMMPLELVMWEWQNVLLHGAFQLVTGALLIEAMFWTFDKVPFTCSYFPGNINLSLLAGLYLYGFTSYSFHLADLERLIETQWVYTVLAFTVAGILLTFSWIRRRPSSTVRFDGEEPAIRSLDLT